ncbi:MAG: hypothetical protein ACPG80_06130 [Rickettsiales bacterium]
MFKRMILAVLTSLFALPAYAVTVKNLTDEPKAIVIEIAREQRKVIIEPGSIYRYHSGGVKVGVPGKSLTYADPWDEYALWPDGTFAIQKRNKNRDQGN